MLDATTGLPGTTQPCGTAGTSVSMGSADVGQTLESTIILTYGSTSQPSAGVFGTLTVNAAEFQPETTPTLAGTALSFVSISPTAGSATGVSPSSTVTVVVRCAVPTTLTGGPQALTRSFRVVFGPDLRAYDMDVNCVVGQPAPTPAPAPAPAPTPAPAPVPTDPTPAPGEWCNPCCSRRRAHNDPQCVLHVAGCRGVLAKHVLCEVCSDTLAVEAGPLAVTRCTLESAGAGAGAGAGTAEQRREQLAHCRAQQTSSPR
jgi:hypothetical protein